MALNNFGLGILLNVKGNAEEKFSGIGSAFSDIGKQLPPGIQSMGKLAMSLGPVAIGAIAATVALKKLFSTISIGIDLAGQHIGGQIH